MAKKAKRREWTKDDVRQLKTLARQKTPVAKIARRLTNSRRDVAEGIYTWCILDLPGVAQDAASLMIVP